MRLRGAVALPEYRLFETRNFQQDLNRLGAAAARRIRATLERRAYPVLRATPRHVPGAARLRDWNPPAWRGRIGSWRIFYEIDVFLTAADHRQSAHR